MLQVQHSMLKNAHIRMGIFVMNPVFFR